MTATTAVNTQNRAAGSTAQMVPEPMPTYSQIAWQITTDPVRRGTAAVVVGIWLMVLPLTTASLVAGGHIAEIHYNARPEGWAEMVLGALMIGTAGAMMALLSGCALTWWATAHLREMRAER